MNTKDILRAVWDDEGPYRHRFGNLEIDALDLLSKYLHSRLPVTMGGGWSYQGESADPGAAQRPLTARTEFNWALQLAIEFINARFDPLMWMKSLPKDGLHTWRYCARTPCVVIAINDQGVDVSAARTPRRMIELVRAAGKLVPTPGGSDA